MHIFSAKKHDDLPKEELEIELSLSISRDGTPTRSRRRNSNRSNDNSNSNDNERKDEEIEQETTYTVRLKEVKQLSLTKKDMSNGEIEYSFMEMGLNIVNRERFAKKDYEKYFRKNCYFSKKDNTFDIITQRSPSRDSLFPDLSLLRGFVTSAHFCKSAIFVKTSIQYKAVTKLSMRDICRDMSNDQVVQYFKPESMLHVFFFVRF